MNRSEIEIFNSVIRHCVFLDSSLGAHSTLADIHKRVHIIWKRMYRDYRNSSNTLTPQTVDSIKLAAVQNDKTT